MKRKEIVRALEQAERTQTLIWLKRTQDARAWRGFVVGHSDEWVLVQKLNAQAMRLAGYAAVRIVDLEQFWWDETFAPYALKLLGERARLQPDVLLIDLPGLLSSVSTLYPLLELFREREQENFHVGRITRFRAKKIDFQIVTRTGEWGEPLKFKYREITRVEFGDGYDEALWLVARRERRRTNE